MKKENIEEIDILLCLKKRNKKIKEYQKKYREANKSRKSEFDKKMNDYINNKFFILLNLFLYALY